MNLDRLNSTFLPLLIKLIKIHYAKIILILILIFTFEIWVNNFNFLIDADDNFRDYLVARHIVHFQEYPIIGPWSFNAHQITTQFINSPLYYYLLAAVLFISDNFILLGFVNILLHLLVITLVYILGRDIFNKNVGLIASLFYSLSFIHYLDKQTSFIWQPWVAQPFFYLALVLLLKFYKFKKTKFLLLGILSLIISGTLHIAFFSMVPMIFLLIFLTLKLQKSPRAKFFFVGIFTVLIILFFFLPVIFYNLKSFDYNSGVTLSQNISLGNFTGNFVNNTSNLTNIYLLKEGTFNLQPILIVLFIIILFIISIFYFKKNPRYLILASLIVQPLVFISTFKLNSATDIGRYFTPSLGLLFILLVGVIDGYQRQNKLLYVIKISIYLMLLGQIFNIPTTSPIKPKISVALVEIKDAKIAIENEISNIKLRENIKDYNFFTIKMYKKESNFPSAIFWSFLEIDLNTRFTQTSNTSVQGYKELNNNTYIFLVCFRYLDDYSIQKCKDTFLDQYKNYKLGKELFRQYPFLIIESRKSA